MANPLVRRWTLNFVTIAFAIALALLFVLVLHSISVQITPPPQPLTEPYPDVSTQALCEQAGGRWVESGVVARDGQPAPVVKDGATPQPYCQGPLSFERQQTIQSEESGQTALFVYAIGGALAVAASLLVTQLRPVAPGFMLGGIAAFFFAGFHVWTLSPGIGRLLTIVIVFALLIGVGLYALRDEGKPAKKG